MLFRSQHTEMLPQGKEGQAWNDHCGHSQEELPDLVCVSVCVCVYVYGMRLWEGWCMYVYVEAI